MATDPSVETETKKPEDCIVATASEASESALSPTLKLKTVVKQFDAQTQREGAGFVVNRPIGGRQLSDAEADPFLLLDELGPREYGRGEFEGAPWHPHRGFDTVMYLRQGYGTHQDSMGNKGTLGPGDCQWMTAGRGIIHDEGREHPGGVLHGFQLWVNLPAKHKMCAPAYQTLTEDRFPFVALGIGVKAKAIAGAIVDPTSGKLIVKSPISPIQPIHYFDYELEKDSSFTHVFTADALKLDTVIVYCYRGEGKVLNGGTLADASKATSDASDSNWVSLKRKRTLVFGKGDAIHFRTNAGSDLGFLLLAGKPIGEPIARRGPFVMNTMEEIAQAFEDYRNGTLAIAKGKEMIK